MVEEGKLTSLGVAELLDRLKQGTVTAEQLVTCCRNEIESQNNRLNAILATNYEDALDRARQIDHMRSTGQPLGLLAGIPIVVKDGICTKGITTTAGSRMLESFVPPYDATAVERLLQHDAIVLAKSSMDEFAMGGSNENPHFGPARNPWNTEYVPGGSSGGSAIAVASGMAPIALGSDTGGSVRQPAAFCGITGLKPTYGRVSRFGLIAFGSSLDQIGPLARSAEDCALVLDAIAGHDPSDSTSAPQPPVNFTASINRSLDGIRIGICEDHLNDNVDDCIVAAVDQAKKVFETLGAQVVNVRLPHTGYGVAAYYLLAPCEASSNLARYDGVRYSSRAEANSLDEMYAKTRAECFGPEVQRRIMLGTFALSSGYYDQYYVKASKIRRLIKQDYDDAWKQVDMILGPTAPTPAFRIGEKIEDPLSMYLADVFTVSANLAGIPAISFPGGFSENDLPIGIQLQGRSFDESRLLNAVHRFQEATQWHLRRPS